jgi:hypothetical protein
MSTDTSNTIFTAAEAETLPSGQWVFDADGTARCLVDTNIGWPQRMWMNNGGNSYTAIEGIAYPLRLADLEEECPHSWGTQECGHCRCCGQVVAPARELDWQFLTIAAPISQEGGKP